MQQSCRREAESVTPRDCSLSIRPPRRERLNIPTVRQARYDSQGKNQIIFELAAFGASSGRRHSGFVFAAHVGRNCSATAFADELEREKVRQRVIDALSRKARAGYVAGGRVFGYDNVPICDGSGRRSHVELRINEAEATVVVQIFALCAEGLGVKAIALRLNTEGALCPRPRRAAGRLGSLLGPRRSKPGDPTRASRVESGV
jgi:hypothetical protein